MEDNEDNEDNDKIASSDEKLKATKASPLYNKAALLSAVGRHEFALVYQPIVLCETNEITGVEALLRWNHPKRGAVAPLDFLSIAEQSGVIVPIGKWVLGEACRQMRSWHELMPHQRHLTISVNVSADEFTATLPAAVREALAASGLGTESLNLEIKESAIMNNPEAAAAIFSELKDSGVKVQMDDFGTGLSSLGHLYVFPIDALKIDYSFIQSMFNDEQAMNVVRTIIAMGHNMKMKVIAEGVETSDQLQELRRLNCDCYQGYWFSKPLNRKEAEALIDVIQ